MSIYDYRTGKIIALLEENNKRQVKILLVLEEIGRDIRMIKDTQASVLKVQKDRRIEDA